MHARRCILVELVCVGARALCSGSKMHNVAVFVSEWVIHLYVFINGRFCTWPSPSACLAKE